MEDPLSVHRLFIHPLHLDLEPSLHHSNLYPNRKKEEKEEGRAPPTIGTTTYTDTGTNAGTFYAGDYP